MDIDTIVEELSEYISADDDMNFLSEPLMMKLGDMASMQMVKDVVPEDKYKEILADDLASLILICFQLGIGYGIDMEAEVERRLEEFKVQMEEPEEADDHLSADDDRAFY